MGDFIREEFSIFLEAAWYGMMIAISYDVLRILRRIVKHHDIMVGIQDFLFWVAVGIVVFAMIFQCNDGVVRGYIFMALLLGAYAYHKSVSSLIVKYLSKILNFFLTLLLKKPLKWARIILVRVFKIFITPFKLLAGWINSAFKGIRAKHGKHNDKKKKKRKTGDIRD